MRRPRPPTKAQPLGFVSFFAALLVAGLIWIMREVPREKVGAKRENYTGRIESDVRREAVQNGNKWTEFLMDNTLLWIVIIAFFGLIVYTVYLRRAGP